MIVTVALDPAVGVSYAVDRLERGRSHAVLRVVERPVGDGIAVARFLHAMGEHALVVAPLGGPTGQRVAQALADEGLPVRPVPFDGETRRTVTVLDGVETVLNEPTSQLHVDDWSALVDAVAGSLVGARALVVPGRLPPGGPADLVARLVRVAGDERVPVLISTAGPALVAAAEAGPTVVSCTTEELRTTTGEADPLLGARWLVRRGAHWVVLREPARATGGSAGLCALSADAGWLVRPVAGMPDGATPDGACTVAALASALAEGVPWPDPLVHAVAAAAAGALSAPGDELDLAAYRRLLPGLRAEQLAMGER